MICSITNQTRTPAALCVRAPGVQERSRFPFSIAAYFAADITDATVLPALIADFTIPLH